MRRRALVPLVITVTLAATVVTDLALAYPTDEGPRTGIRRLVWQDDVDNERRKGRKTPPGAHLDGKYVKLRMTQAGRGFELNAATPKDPALQAGLEEILKRQKWRDYHIALLDITDPAKPRYAGIAETQSQTPGSVAKVLVGAGLMQQLKERFRNDFAAREKLLRETMVVADDFALPNHHEVPVVNGASVAIRAVRAGDTFSLWEWMDHMLSPSSNAAASMTWREATLMRLLGEQYPPAKRDAALWKTWDKSAFTSAVFDVVEKPLREAGLSTEDFIVRMFFTKGAGKYIRSQSSHATPLALLQWLVRVEQGRMVDEWSSLELKKMLYLTRRRVRYVKSPNLKDAVVYFKSGSLYRCQPEEGYTCAQYEGNQINVLNGLVEVETAGNFAEAMPEVAKADDAPRVYLVAVMSNELKKNAAKDHEQLAGEIHNLVAGKRGPVLRSTEPDKDDGGAD